MMFLAQVASQSSGPSEWAAPLTNLGVAGYMIYFLTTRGEAGLKNLASEIKKMSCAMDRWSKTQLIAMLLHPNLPPEARQPAKNMIDEIDQTEK